MQQHKVKKRFIDQNTGEIREVGETITVTDQRARELQESGHVTIKPTKSESDEKVS